jgi:hypothetical protein
MQDMARELKHRDLQILKKLVPELEEIFAEGVEVEYRNILPPVANHHSRDEADFQERLMRLSPEEMRYLADLILDGSEGLGCLYPEYALVFFTLASRMISTEVADQLRKIYEESEGCGG